MNGNNVHTRIRPNSHPSPSTGKVTNSIPPPLTGEGKGGGDASCRWDSLIQQSVQTLWPGTDWRLIKCQVRQESAFNPKIVSPCGAIGLMQIMPATGESLGLTKNMLCIPEENIKAGIIYLKRQYERFPEIPDYRERLKFALASYNGGRGYINQAVALARKEDALWQTWEGVKPYLAKKDCMIGGKHPDHRQIIAYVARIWADYSRLSPPAPEVVIPAQAGIQENKT